MIGSFISHSLFWRDEDQFSQVSTVLSPFSNLSGFVETIIQNWGDRNLALTYLGLMRLP